MNRAGVLALCLGGVAAIAASWLHFTNDPMVAPAVEDARVALRPGAVEQPPSDPNGLRVGPHVVERSASTAVVDDDLEGDDRNYKGPFIVTGDVVLEDLTIYGDWNQPDVHVPVPRSGLGRVRLIPLGPLRGRGLVELPLLPGVPFSSVELQRGDYAVEVFEPGYAPSIDTVGPGWYAPSFICYTRPGPAVALDVRLPDGSQPTHALLTPVRQEWVAGWEPQVRPALRELQSDDRKDSYKQYYVWTPSDPRTGFVRQSSGLEMDFVVFAEPDGESPYDARAFCRYHSGFVRFDPRAPSPVRVELEEAAAVTISLDRPLLLDVELAPWVQAVRLDGLVGIDAATLLASWPRTWPEEHFRRPDLDWLVERMSGAGSREACYLAPGHWRFAASWGDEPPTVFHDVDIALGRNAVDLTLGQPTTTGHVPVRYSGDDPPSPRKEERVSYVAFTVEPHMIIRSDIELSRGSRGECWLLRRDLEALLAEAQDARPVYLARLERERPRSIGYVSGPLDVAIPEVVLAEVPAAEVQFWAEHSGSGTFQLAVYAQLLEVTAEDARLMRVAADKDLESDWFSFDFGRDLGRAQAPVALLPGRWRFSFQVTGAPLLELAPVEVVLAPGRPQAVTVEVPDRFVLTVHAPTVAAGVKLRLRQLDLPAGHPARDYAELDSTHRALFRGLPAGHYVLTQGASHSPLNIVVPCGVVDYAPSRSDAFEVRLAPLESGAQGALARAGFQTGDVLLDFNGRGLREHDDLDALLDVIAESEASVRVRRGAHTLELRLGPMPDPGDPWATFDADFVPAWR